MELIQDIQEVSRRSATSREQSDECKQCESLRLLVRKWSLSDEPCALHSAHSSYVLHSTNPLTVTVRPTPRRDHQGASPWIGVQRTGNARDAEYGSHEFPSGGSSRDTDGGKRNSVSQWRCDAWGTVRCFVEIKGRETFAGRKN